MSINPAKKFKNVQPITPVSSSRELFPSKHTLSFSTQSIFPSCLTNILNTPNCFPSNTAFDSVVTPGESGYRFALKSPSMSSSPALQKTISTTAIISYFPSPTSTNASGSLKPYNQSCSRTQRRRKYQIRAELEKFNKWLSNLDLEIGNISLVDKKREETGSTNNKRSFTINYENCESDTGSCDAFRALKVKTHLRENN